MTQQSIHHKTILQAMCLFACLMVIVSITGCGQPAPTVDTTDTSKLIAPAEQSTTPTTTTSIPTIPTPIPVVKPTTKPTPPPVAKTSFKDGSYTVDGLYNSPAGEESITVSVTLKNDHIADATVVGHAMAPRSKMMQNAFISGFKQLVVGKNITDVQLDKVSGSSLTPKGFNDAIAKIEVQAKA